MNEKSSNLNSNPKASSEFTPGPNWNEMMEAFTGLEMKMVRTVRDLIIAPVKIGQRALEGNREDYIGQARLFMVLIGLQTLVFSLTQFYTHVNAEQLLQHDPKIIGLYSDYLVDNGFTLDQVNSKIHEWFNLLFTPINAFVALVYGALFKLFDRRYTYFGHVLLYITASNAMTLIALPFTALSMFDTIGFQIYSAVYAFIQLVLLGVFVWYFYVKSLWAGIGKIAALLIFYIAFVFITSIILWGITDLAISREFGQGPFLWIINNLEAARELSAMKE